MLIKSVLQKHPLTIVCKRGCDAGPKFAELYTTADPESIRMCTDKCKRGSHS